MNPNHTTCFSERFPLQAILRSLATAITCYAVICPGTAAAQTPLPQTQHAEPSLAASPNSLESYFANSGVEFPGGQRFPVALPALRSVPSPADPSKTTPLLEDLAGKVGWKRFSRKNLNAPVVTKVTKLEDGDQTVGYSLVASYIVYGDMEQLREQDLLESTFGTGDKPELAEKDQDELSFTELTADTVAALDLNLSIAPHANPKSGSPNLAATDEVRFASINLPLLNKVLIQGLVRLEKVERGDGLELYWLLEPRWQMPSGSPSNDPRQASTNSRDLPPKNSWRPLTKNDLGGTDIGEASPYFGFGGYVSVYPTGLADDQLLIQSTLIIHEPNDWFNRSNFLRGKLVLSASEAAKKLRRTLR